MTRTEMVAIINGGGSVMLGGKIISRVADLPSAGALAASNEADVLDANRNTSHALIFQGAWSATASYQLNDAVSSSGATYRCIVAHTNHVPTDATYWAVLAAVGVQGAQGSAGAQGSQGAVGAQGPQGSQGTAG